MRSRSVWSIGVVAAFLALIVLAAGVAAAQAPSAVAKSGAVPRTPWGAPDLQGVWTGSTMTTLERPASLAGKAYLTPEEAGAMEKKAKDEALVDRQPPPCDPGTSCDANVNFFPYNRIWLESSTSLLPDRRTSLIIDPPDGRIPFKPEAKRMNDFSRDRYGKGPFNSYRDPDTGERCLTDGVPIPYFTGYNNNIQIVQSPNEIVIVGEMYGNRRIVPLTPQPREEDIPQWLGRPRGGWEGDTLVVETTNFADKNGEGFWWADYWRSARPTLKLTERFTRVNADTIDYQFAMEDPSMFTRPWTAKYPLTNDQARAGVTVGRLYEYACHEGNQSIVNILSGARALEKAPAEAAKRSSN